MLHVVINKDSKKGSDRNLDILVLKPDGRPQCSGSVSPSLIPSCQNLLDIMPAGQKFEVWGPADDILPPDITLPKTYYSREFFQLDSFSPPIPFTKTSDPLTKLIDMNAYRGSEVSVDHQHRRKVGLVLKVSNVVVSHGHFPDVHSARKDGTAE